MSILRVACIGAGYFSQFHYDSWNRETRVLGVGACDIDLERAQATGWPAFNDLASMLGATSPDLLDVILPPQAQAKAIMTALEKGVKTIICQKPFCNDIDEAQAVIHAAEAAGTRIVIHENFRFQPWYRGLKMALENNLIGQVLQITFRLRPGDGQGPNAYLDRQPYFQTMPKLLIHETGVHWIDTFRYLLGEPIAIYADLRRVNPAIKGEDAGYVIFDHPGGVRALFDGNRCLDHASDNTRRTMGEALVEGTEGTIDLSGDGSLWLRHFGGSAETCLMPADTWEGFGGDCVHTLQRHVVSGLIDGAPLENLAQEYVKVIRIENAIYLSTQTGGKVDLGAK